MEEKVWFPTIDIVIRLVNFVSQQLVMKLDALLILIYRPDNGLLLRHGFAHDARRSTLLL